MAVVYFTKKTKQSKALLSPYGKAYPVKYIHGGAYVPRSFMLVYVFADKLCLSVFCFTK